MRTIATIGLAAFAVLSPGVFLTAAEHTTDSLETVRKNTESKKALLVDVREDKEWKQGHVEGSMLVPLSMLEKVGEDEAFLKQLAAVLVQQIPTDRVIYTYCGSGVRSVKAGGILKKMGYDVRPLKAGYEDLIEAGFPQSKEKE